MNYAMTPGGLVVPNESLLHDLPGKLSTWLSPDEIWQKLLKPMLVGIVPAEGELVALQMLFKRVLTNRDADMQLGLFTNVAPGDGITEATITEPTGTGYARITLTDATWTSANPTTYAEQTFTGGAGGWTGSIQGYFINTNAAGGTPALVVVEVDSAGPYTIAENDTYAITPSITASDAAD